MWEEKNAPASEKEKNAPASVKKKQIAPAREKKYAEGGKKNNLKKLLLPLLHSPLDI